MTGDGNQKTKSNRCGTPQLIFVVSLCLRLFVGVIRPCIKKANGENSLIAPSMTELFWKEKWWIELQFVIVASVLKIQA